MDYKVTYVLEEELHDIEVGPGVFMNDCRDEMEEILQGQGITITLVKVEPLKS